MLPSIDFNDQASFETCKVDDIAVNRHLPTESFSFHLTLAEYTAQSALRVRHRLAKNSCVLVWHRCGGTPHPKLPPQGGKEFQSTASPGRTLSAALRSWSRPGRRTPRACGG